MRWHTSGFDSISRLYRDFELVLIYHVKAMQ